MKKIKRVLLALCGLSLVTLAGCKKEADDLSNVIPVESICDKEEMTGLTKPVSNEADLVKVMESTVLEINSILGGVTPMPEPECVPGSRSVSNPNPEAKTVDEAVKQVIDYVNEFVAQVSVAVQGMFGEDFDISSIENFNPNDIYAYLGSLLSNDFVFNFDKDINIGQLKFTEWFDVVSESAFEVYKAMIDGMDEDFEGPVFESKEDVKQYLIAEIGMDEVELAQVEEYLKILDDFVVVKKYYLGTKLNANLKLKDILSQDSDGSILDSLKDKITDNKDAISNVAADISTEVSLSLQNINKFVQTVMGADGEEVEEGDEAFNLALKGIALYVKADVDVNVTSVDLSSWLAYFANPQAIPTINKGNISGVQQLGLALCTAEGEGGYITITAKEKAAAPEVLDLIEIMYEEKENPEKLETEITKVLNKVISVNVKVSDGTNTTFEQNYNYTQFMESYGEFFGNSNSEE